MKQFKLTILLTILLCMVGVKAMAHDIEAKNADGVTIYYKWEKGKTGLIVSYQGSKYSAYEDEYWLDVVIPESVNVDGRSYPVTSIGDEAFKYCSGLTSITIPSSVTSIGNEAFLWCERLTSITIPSSVTKISGWAFIGCISLSSIIVMNGNTVYDSRNNCNAIIETATNELIAGCQNTVIPNSVTSIGDYAFNQCDGLTSITIPNSVTSIGDCAFNGCDGLAYVYIGYGVREIGDRAFYGCSGRPKIYLFPLTPPYIYEKTFDRYVTLLINQNGKEEYSKTSYWFNIFSWASSYDWHIFDPSDFNINFDGNEGGSEAPKQEYTLTYIVDGEVYKTVTIKEEESIMPETEPTKEGYTFSGWSEIPEIMPANNVTITGIFTVNKYKLTYKVDGEEYKSFEIEYGTTITPPETDPVKEGYTFSGWSEIPETMPADDVTVTGTFTKGSYKLTYMVDGAVYKTVTYDYGTSITLESAPTKEGYTFSGWSETPQTMPAEDVTVMGSFTINKYKLTYVIDGQEYKSYEIEYGASTTAEPTPTKEGYTFSGWSWIPSKMPAEDVIVTGTYIAIKYKLTYKVDGVEYKTSEIEYGAAIIPETAPSKEGYTFSGWSWMPSKMPAEDVTITGMFVINKYKISYIIDGEVYKTEEVEYGAEIHTPNPEAHEGYDFTWGDYPSTMPAEDITINGTYTPTDIKAVFAIEPDVKIFTVSGKPLNKLQKGINIIKMSDGSTKKVLVK